MLLGIISDTHDNLASIDKAFEIFKSRQVGLIIHCGDWVAPFSVGHFGKLANLANIPVKGVFGNNEGDKEGIREINARLSEPIEFPSNQDYLEFGAGGKLFAVTHGHQTSIVEQLVEAKKYWAIFLGHAHIPLQDDFEGIRILNPGAACLVQRGEIVGKATLGIYETETGNFEIVEYIP